MNVRVPAMLDVAAEMHPGRHPDTERRILLASVRLSVFCRPHFAIGGRSNIPLTDFATPPELFARRRRFCAAWPDID
jgi:hypothetical protein